MTNESLITQDNAYKLGYRFKATYIADGRIGQRFFRHQDELEEFTGRYATYGHSTGAIDSTGKVIAQ